MEHLNELQKCLTKFPEYVVIDLFNVCNEWYGQCLLQHKDFVDDITFVIQGPSTWSVPVSKFFCFQYGAVVDATWNRFPIDEVTKHIQKNQIHNEQNIYYQIISTLNGLSLVKSRYAIKVRSDCYIRNWSTFVHFLRGTNKLVTLDLFVRKYTVAPYHLSDHVMGCSTALLIKGFTVAKTILDHHWYDTYPGLCPETLLTKSFVSVFCDIPIQSLYSRDEQPGKSKQQLLKTAFIVPLACCGEFSSRINGKGIIWRHVSEIPSNELVSSIEEIYTYR